MSRFEKLQLIISYGLSLIMLIAIGEGFLTGQWFNAFLASIAFGLTYIPALVERNYRITLPLEFELVLVIFVYASVYLGEVKSFYETFPWWDTFMHTLSGFLLGFVGFVIIFVLHDRKAFQLRLSPFFIGFFSFIFSVALAGLWEVFEFSLDLAFDLGYQESLQDTMVDIIVNILGSLCVAFAASLYIKGGSIAILSPLLKKFMQRNPRLFDPLKRR